jgi:hypothetical protein
MTNRGFKRCALPKILLILLFSSLAYAWSEKHMPEPAKLSCDLEGDGYLETLIFTPGKPKALAIWREGKLIYEGIPETKKPWKLVIADVDGDGSKEIIVGVHKKTRYFPEPHNCLFVYGWDGTGLYARWMGSRLSKPFFDFAFTPPGDDKQQHLVSLEETPDGRKCIAVYEWSGFGFDGVWQEKGFDRKCRLIRRDNIVSLKLPDGRELELRRQGESYSLQNR